jgi:hypothetical protein
MPAAAPLLHKPKEEAARSAPAISAPPVSIVARSPTSIARSADPARSTIISPLSAQAKGFISSPDDASEREADRVADNVVAMPKSAARPRASNAAVARSIMRSPLIAQRAPSPANTNAAPAGQAAVAAEIKAAATGGFALPKKTRAFLEPRFKADLSQVMLHNDATAKKLSNKIGARAFTYGRHIFFNEGQYNPDSREGLKLLAHELTHTIQQSETIQRKAASTEAPRVTERTGKQASRLGISDVLNFFADAANAIPGYRMFTILIGVNPINMASVEASAANILRAIVEFLPGGNIITRVLDSYGVFDKVGGWIEGQLKSLGISGPAIKAALDRFTGDLGFSDIFDLGGVWNRAKRIFTTPITRIIDFAKGLFSKILEFVQEAVLKPLAALAAQTPFYTLLKAVLGKDPVSGEKFEGGATEVIGGFMTMIGQEELWQNIQRANAIPRAFAWFKTAMKGLMGLVTSIPTRFIDGLKGLEIMDFVVLPRAFLKIGAVLGSFLVDFGSWALGTVIDLLKIIVEAVAPGVMPYISKAAGAFNTILKNPIGFVGNLVRAGVQGFRQFASNFLRHLQTAMVGWLTGAMQGANIYIPQGLSLREILKFVLSILGLTWQNIRGKLVRATNETTVVALETGFDIVRTLMTEGPAAAWQKILETLTNLQQMAIDAIKDFIKQRVVEAAVTRLVSMLNPAGAFIQAIIAIYNTVMFFVERLRQIAAVAASFIDAIAAIASGNIGPAANRVETTMAGLLVLVISFLARIAGLGRVADAVTGLIQRVRAPIDRALERVVAWIVAQARRLGRFILQAGVPADPNARLRLAIRDARVIAERLGPRISRPLLETGLGVVRTRYSLTALVVTQRAGEWFVRATINPSVEERVATASAANAAAVRALYGTQIVAQGRPATLIYTRPISGYSVRLGGPNEYGSIRANRQPAGAPDLPVCHLNAGGVLTDGRSPGTNDSDEPTKLASYRAVAEKLGLAQPEPNITAANVTRTSNSAVRNALQKAIVKNEQYKTLTQFNRLISSGSLTGQGMQGELFEAWIVEHFGSKHGISDQKIKYKTDSGVGLMDRYTGDSIVEMKSRIRPNTPAYRTFSDDQIPSTAFAIEARDRAEFTRYAEILSGSWQSLSGTIPNLVEPQKFTRVRYYFNFRGCAIKFNRLMPATLKLATTFFVGDDIITNFEE